ncbi:KPTN [Branchiostoma lanceolatum]|uniref:KPTN protein n=1 Tax=Branchiostoma lanceolatum TaxID=7740 RepID=A0A8K0ER75_BRALA|nr:KPTN [Branchiostoma lanceolatum]
MAACGDNIGMYEASFSRLPSQSNVYGLSVLSMPTWEGNKLLVASLSGGKMFCLEYQRLQGVVRLVSREVHFAYIPGDADIVSIDSFNREVPQPGTLGGLVIGITFIKDPSNSPAHYLNIYSAAVESGLEYSLDTIAQSCMCNIELQFIPFQLTHTRLCDEDGGDTVFLLGGNDQQIHLFRQDRETNQFVEENITDCFPEFDNLPGNAVWMDTQRVGGHKRITAFGCEDGHVNVAIVNEASKEIQCMGGVQHDGPITSVRIYRSKLDTPCPAALGSKAPPPAIHTTQEGEYHLVVTSVLELAVVYREVMLGGLTRQAILPESNLYDSALCCCVGDVDWDGRNEVIIGTYGQELLVYKYCEGSSRSRHKSNSSVASEKSASLESDFTLLWRRSFAHPILALAYLDMTRDGLWELVVISTKGCHILQHSLEEAAGKVTERLESLTLQGNGSK